MQLTPGSLCVCSMCCRGGSLFEIQRGSLESGARPCVQCGGMHYTGATAAAGATACPVWQAANAVLAPEPTKGAPASALQCSAGPHKSAA